MSATRSAFLARKEQQFAMQSKADTKKLNESKSRLAELDRLMRSVYEDKVMGKIPEHLCVNFLQKYEAEQQELRMIVDELGEKLSAEKQDMEDVEEFIRMLKKYRASLKTSPFAFLRKAKGLCVGLRPTPPPLKT